MGWRSTFPSHAAHCRVLRDRHLHVCLEPSEPHFHATYAGDEARYAISDGQLIEGELPKSQDKKVREWAQAHREQLSRNWDLCESGQAPERIS
ncbi:hypothetical protein MMAG44476_21947 [Mycolicibacterium mageritense DSM 44476 = CIP 104973]|uniref:DUF4160 domain-containing protein n=1 Tax=Mycolicibacterium TaxID=1866885 RepID=UPI000A03ADD8